MSLYAATKKANELMAHTYSHLFDLPTTGLRFFTVYGPWGRPDMALFLFTKAILEGRAIDVFNNGEMMRDFHVHRRHCRRRRARDGLTAAPDDAAFDAASPRSCTQRRALANLQHREQPAPSDSLRLHRG